MRKPNNHFVRKEDLIYTPSVGISDGFAGGLSAAAGDRELAKQMFAAANAIQQSEDELRRKITVQQNQVLLLDAKNKLSAINQGLYEELKYDPDKFKIASNEQATKVINELPLLLRDEAKAAFISEQTGYFSKARSNQLDYLEKQTFEQLQVNNKNLAKAAVSAVNGLFVKDGITDVQAQIDLAGSILGFEKNLTTPNRFGQPMFNQKNGYEESQKFYGTIFESFADLQLGSFDSAEDGANFIDNIENGTATINFVSDGTEFNIPSAILDYGKRRSISAHLQQAQKEGIRNRKKMVSRQYVSDVKSGAKPAMPGVKEYQQQVDIDFEDEYAALAQRLNLDTILSQLPKDIQVSPPEVNEAINAVSGYVTQMKIVPSGLKQRLESWSKSNNPVLLKMSSEIISSIRANVPQEYSKLDNLNFAAADVMAKELRSGNTLQGAFDVVVQNCINVDPILLERRNKEFNSHIKEEFNDVAPANMFFNQDTKYIEQFKEKARQEFLRGVDINTAKSIAKEVLSNHYGESIINGFKAFMEFPPEKFYTIPGVYEADEMRFKLEEFGKKLKIDPSRICVFADEKTYLEIGEGSKPTYVVCVRTDDGSILPYYDKQLQYVRVGKDLWWSETEQKEFEEIRGLNNEELWLNERIRDLRYNPDLNYEPYAHLEAFKLSQKLEKAKKEKKEIGKNRRKKFIEKQQTPELLAKFKSSAWNVRASF